MKYNIMIQQKVILDNNLKIDLVDASILEIISDMPLSEKIEKKYEGNVVFFWVNHLNIAKENPMLGIKTSDGIYRRMMKLSEMGLIYVHPHNKKSKKSFYAISDLSFSIFKGNTSDEKPKESLHRIRNRSDIGFQSEVTSDEKPKDYTIIDNTINDDILNIKGETSSPNELFPDYPTKEIGKPVKQKKGKKPAHPAHYIIRKFWFEDFKKGLRFEPGAGVFINNIIKNIQGEAEILKHDADTDYIVNSFKELCYKSREINDNYFSLFSLKDFSSASSFGKITEKLKRDGKQISTFKQSGQRSGVTNFKFNVPDPREKPRQNTGV